MHLCNPFLALLALLPFASATPAPPIDAPFSLFPRNASASSPSAVPPFPSVYPYNEIGLEATDGSIRAVFLPYAATVTELWVKDREGQWRDVVLGYDNKTNYGTDPIHPRFGPIVGRYANRIKNGTFVVDGITYHTPLNENGRDTLHGGTIGYDNSSFTITNLSSNSVTFSHYDPDGNQGFPGAVTSHATYTLLPNSTWHLTLTATATKRTPLMLSSHTYWNLEAYRETQNIMDHMFHLPKADKVVKTDSILIPTGDYIDVGAVDAYDFRQARSFGSRFNATQGFCGANCLGYDTCFVQSYPQRYSPAIEMWSPHSGIKLTVTSDQKAIQVYTCDGIASATLKIPRKASQGGDGTTNVFYDNHSCVVLEMEDVIDAINYPSYGRDEIYGPDRPYLWNAEYKFSTV